MATLSTLELRCFGAPTARLDGRDPPPDVLWRKHLALLIYLALSPNRTRARDHLVGLLWPEKPEKDARHSLNEAVRRLRQSLGDDRLISRPDSVTLHDVGLEVDALRFLAMADRDPADALGLYTADFLEGLTIDDAPTLEEWVSAERERFRARAMALLLDSGEKDLAACLFVDAQGAARRMLSSHPFHEPAARLLMRAAALSGDAAGALATYREFSDRLSQGLGEKPSRELAALAERVRQNTWRPTAMRRAEAEPPLVGRAQAHADAFATMERGLTEGSQTLLISGAPGMGRTRLLGECAARLMLEGATVATARPLANDTDVKWSTLRLLVRSGLGQMPGLVGAAPDALAVLAAVAPDIGTKGPAVEPRDAAQVAAALSAALRSAAEEQPVGIAIDDAHYADQATLSALAGAMERLPDARVTLLLAVPEPVDNSSADLLHLRGAIGRSLPGATVRLDPLSETDLGELTRHLAPWCADPSQQHRLTRRLAAETSGNPFFAVTLLRGFERLATLREDFVAWPRPQVTFDTPLPFTLPDLVGTAIAARLVELDARAQGVLAAATIGGLAFDLDLIAALTHVSRLEVEDSLVAAERRHLVVFDGDRYAFAAPLIADVVRRECLTAGQRRSMARRAAELLESRGDLESRVLRVELLSRADGGPETFGAALGLAREARAVGAARATSRAIAAAERAAGKTPTEEQRKMIEDLRAAR